jgi:hypothetical protein
MITVNSNDENWRYENGSAQLDLGTVEYNSLHELDYKIGTHMS